MTDDAPKTYGQITTRTNPDLITIKVTDETKGAYFVHFDRETHELVDVFEHRKIYVPAMGVMAVRIARVVKAARERIGKPLTTATQGN